METKSQWTTSPRCCSTAQPYTKTSKRAGQVGLGCRGEVIGKTFCECRLCPTKGTTRPAMLGARTSSSWTWSKYLLTGSSTSSASSLISLPSANRCKRISNLTQAQLLKTEGLLPKFTTTHNSRLLKPISLSNNLTFPNSDKASRAFSTATALANIALSLHRALSKNLPHNLNPQTYSLRRNKPKCSLLTLLPLSSNLSRSLATLTLFPKAPLKLASLVPKNRSLSIQTKYIWKKRRALTPAPSKRRSNRRLVLRRLYD